MTDETTFYYVRNTVSGVTIAQTAEEAAHILAHEQFKKYHILVDSPKDEVLAQPYWVDDDGTRHPIEGADPIQLPEERQETIQIPTERQDADNAGKIDEDDE